MWNRLKTAILLAILSGIFLLLGSLIGGKDGIIVAFFMAMFLNFISYYYSDKIVLSMYGAKKLDESKFDWIYNMVKDLSQKAQTPMPKLWLVENEMANAFATGRNPTHGSVAVTTGILKVLTPEELRGVLAHELSHIKNRDILVSTTAAVVATAIGYLASFLRYAAFRQSDNDKNKGVINAISILLITILMPIAASLIQLAISRSREYLADETGAYDCGDPLALASALEKLNNSIGRAHLDKNEPTSETTAHLFIVNPFIPGGLSNLFSTHPPMAERIVRLKKIHNELNKRNLE